MKTWIDRICLVAVVAIVVVLTVTALPVLFGGHLEGQMLLLHMFASGALVFALPIFALLFLGRVINRTKSGGLQRLGFWTLVACGLLTIATVFMAMLPIPSTPQMHELLTVHGYAGFAMVPAAAALLFGISRYKTRLTPSDTVEQA